MRKHRGSRPPRFKYACVGCGDREVKLSGRMDDAGRGIYACATCGAMRDQAPPHFAPAVTTVHAPEGQPGSAAADVRQAKREAAIAWARSIGAPPIGQLAGGPRNWTFDDDALEALATKLRPWFTKSMGA